MKSENLFIHIKMQISVEQRLFYFSNYPEQNRSDHIVWNLHEKWIQSRCQFHAHYDKFYEIFSPFRIVSFGVK